MALHCYYQKFSALIILLSMINVNLIQSGSVRNECLNYCSNSGVCYKGKTGPQCICSSKWAGTRCDFPLNATFIEEAAATQNDATDERDNQCTKIPADYCLHDGICYVDTNNIYACYCRFPYAGDHCEEISGMYCLLIFIILNLYCSFGFVFTFNKFSFDTIECYDYCLNNGLCELDSNDEPKCTCTPEWTGVRCTKLVTTTTAATTPTTTTESVLCTRLGPTYCNAGTCTLVGGSPQCLCPPTFAGNRCELIVAPIGM